MGEQKMQNEVHIKIGADGIEFDAKGDADFIARERNAFEEKLLPLGVDAVTRTRNVVQVPQMITASEYQSLPQPIDNTDTSNHDYEDLSRVSLASFIKQKGAETNNDFILCAAFFKEKKGEIQTFSSKNAKDFFSEAKRALPQNVSMAVNQLAQKGYIMEPPNSKGSNSKRYIISTAGEEYVIQMHPKEGKGNKTTAKPHKPRSKVESTYASINADELNLQNYPSVKSLKDFKEKMMVILYIITNEKKGEWFTVVDVECLMTDIFGESVKAQQISDAFRRNKTWFKTETVDGGNREKKRKLLNAGIDYAKGVSAATE